MRLTTYDSAVTLKSGPNGVSVIAAPPTVSRRSRTMVRRPRLARRPAATRPLWPPPITMTSYRFIRAIYSNRPRRGDELVGPSVRGSSRPERQLDQVVVDPERDAVMAQD